MKQACTWYTRRSMQGFAIDVVYDEVTALVNSAHSSHRVVNIYMYV